MVRLFCQRLLQQTKYSTSVTCGKQRAKSTSLFVLMEAAEYNGNTNSGAHWLDRMTCILEELGTIGHSPRDDGAVSHCAGAWR